MTGLAAATAAATVVCPATIQRRAGDVGRADVEAARIDIGRRVASGAVAVQAADGDVVRRTSW